MLNVLNQAALAGAIRITHVYLGHIKRDEDRKVLAHADAFVWDDVEPSVRAILESYLYQVIEGELGQVNFPAMFTGEVLSVARVASEEYDRTRNQPAVEILEGVRDMGETMGDQFNDQMIEFGNTLAYKVMAAGAIKNHLVAVLKLNVIPQLGAQPVHFSFATVINLDDREESVFDEMKSKFVTQVLNNAIKRSKVQVATLFPCLDDDGKESADMLIYAGGGAWFKAMEATRRFNPQYEGKALVKMIAEQNLGGEVPHDLFTMMAEDLIDEAAHGLLCDSVTYSLEKAVGHGIDRLGFQARWEGAFGDLNYRPAYQSLFSTADLEKPVKLKMQAGDVQISIRPETLGAFRRIKQGDRHFILFEVAEPAKVTISKDLDLKIRTTPVEELPLAKWIAGQPA